MIPAEEQRAKLARVSYLASTQDWKTNTHDQDELSWSEREGLQCFHKSLCVVHLGQCRARSRGQGESTTRQGRTVRANSPLSTRRFLIRVPVTQEVRASISVRADLTASFTSIGIKSCDANVLPSTGIPLIEDCADPMAFGELCDYTGRGCGSSARGGSRICTTRH